MKARRILRTSIALLAVTAIYQNPAIAQQSSNLTRAQELVDNLRGRIKAAPALQADFTQTFSSEFFDETESSSGTVVLKGRKYRVETPTQVFVSDGVTTWIYDIGADQVLINDYVEDETTVSLNRFLFSTDDEYRTADLTTVDDNGEQTVAIVLESADPAAFFPRCKIMLRSWDEELVGLEVVDLNGTTVRFDLRNISYDPPESKLNFEFDPTAVGDVVDLRSS